MVVHLYGERCHIPEDIKVPIIEDCCEALWIKPRGIGCYSFYGNKAITTGEGGMLVGLDARDWRDGGFDEEYRNVLPGLNYRMSNLQAAVGLAQLERFDSMLAVRLRNAARYKDSLPGLGKWLFVVRTGNPRGLRDHLAENGVSSRFVFTPLHRSPAFRAYARGKYKNSDAVWENGLCLPTGPHLTEEQQEKVTSLVHSYLRRSSIGNL